jgi:SRSO17 transposase
LAAGQQACVDLIWRRGSKGLQRGRFLALRVRPAGVTPRRLRWRVEQDYRELKGALGLDHFEGRSFPGWHHHVTLVSVAHGFLTLERLRSPNLVASA